MAKDLHLKKPVGMKDYLPGEAATKRVLEQKLLAVMAAWGYQEVASPTLEYYQAMVAGGNSAHEGLFKLLDRQGNILALRGDMTTPIARLTATRLKEWPLPLRLCYLANVFAFTETQMGKQREFFQAGIELLGTESVDGDGEVIALTVAMLKASGLENFQVHLGQMAVFYGVMEELGFSEAEMEAYKTYLANKDFVAIENQLGASGISKAQQERAVKLLTLRGGADVLVQARELTGNAKALAGLANLQGILAVLKSYGVDEYVTVDFSVWRGFDYYTGAVFEGYAPNLGFPVVGGGRYDKLVAEFGYDCPATGFAIGIERLLLALERQGLTPQVPGLDYLVVYHPDQLDRAIAQATKLRAEGYRVEMLVDNGKAESTAIHRSPAQEVVWLK